MITLKIVFSYRLLQLLITITPGLTTMQVAGLQIVLVWEITVPYGVLGPLWRLIVKIPDLYIIPYFGDIADI